MTAQENDKSLRQALKRVLPDFKLELGKRVVVGGLLYKIAGAQREGYIGEEKDALKPQPLKIAETRDIIIEDSILLGHAVTGIQSHVENLIRKVSEEPIRGVYKGGISITVYADDLEQLRSPDLLVRVELCVELRDEPSPKYLTNYSPLKILELIC